MLNLCARKWTLALSALLFLPATGVHAGCARWPGWVTFKQQFVSEDGRVIDRSDARLHSTSEGQAYGMFLALVANDRRTFDLLLRWTENNLAGGDLSARLPGWQWGRRDDATWGLLDANAASDADVWMAYALGQAGRLWGEPRYTALGTRLADRALREETAWVPGLGRVLLPGPVGFGPWRRDGRLSARLNASYLALPVLRWLAVHADPAWHAVLDSSLQVLREGAPLGLASDWVLVEAAEGAAPRWHWGQAQTDRVGSYNAIRVYLWLGLTAPQDPARRALLDHFAPMADLVARTGVPPESIDALLGTGSGTAPVGFSAALMPFLQALGRTDAAAQQHARLQAQPPRPGAYYEQVLSLFALGFRDARYRFDEDGRLLPDWTACDAASSPSR